MKANHRNLIDEITVQIEEHIEHIEDLGLGAPKNGLYFTI
jgi:hypothetical protein